MTGFLPPDTCCCRPSRFLFDSDLVAVGCLNSFGRLPLVLLVTACMALRLKLPIMAKVFPSRFFYMKILGITSCFVDVGPVVLKAAR